jgi:hypothetical protein
MDPVLQAHSRGMRVVIVEVRELVRLPAALTLPELAAILGQHLRQPPLRDDTQLVVKLRSEQKASFGGHHPFCTPTWE